MKAINIALKTLKEALRDPQLLIMFLAFPGMMVLIYFFAYGSGTKSLANSLILLVDNQDRGVLGGELIEAFRAQEFDGAALLTVIETHDTRMARTTLNEWKAGALLTIPSDFTEVLKAADPNQPPRCTSSAIRFRITRISSPSCLKNRCEFSSRTIPVGNSPNSS